MASRGVKLDANEKPVPRVEKAYRLPVEVALSEEVQKARREGKNVEECFAIALKAYPKEMRAAVLEPSPAAEPVSVAEAVNVSLPETDRTGSEVHRTHKKR